jgi:hypothetical protein
MKRLYWLFFAFLILSCSRGDQIRIKGVVENGSGMIYLEEQGLLEIRQVDSIQIKKDGSFHFKDNIEIPSFYNIHLGNQSIIPLLLHPGDKLEIYTKQEGFASDYNLIGSEDSQYLLELNGKLTTTRKSLDSLSTVFEENLEAGEEVLAGIRTAYNEIILSQRSYSIDFILEHMTSMAAIYALYQKIDENSLGVAIDALG